jgi:hypothetical protein
MSFMVLTKFLNTLNKSGNKAQQKYYSQNFYNPVIITLEVVRTIITVIVVVKGYVCEYHH